VLKSLYNVHMNLKNTLKNEKYSETITVKKVVYTKEEFILLCVEAETATQLAKSLEVSTPTVHTAINKYFPEIKSSDTYIRSAPLGTNMLYYFGMKKCPKCSEIQTVDSFYSTANSVRPGKYSSYCKACSLEATASCNKKYADKREHYREQYEGKNPEKKRAWVNASSAKRRAAKLNRTPSWADLEKIKEVYANCPEGYHVDHIIPLQGKTVSGLHVETNLQYLTAEENLKKGNKFE